MTNHIRHTLPTPLPVAPGDVLSYVHIGDLHLTTQREQNFLDLQTIASEINASFRDSVSFLYLPGDNAEHGAADEYELARWVLDELTVPCFSIVGDHDVHSRSLALFHRYMMPAEHFQFDLSGVRFIGVNAFASADPKRFELLPQQLRWLRDQFQNAAQGNLRVVLLMHCYPSDLSSEAEELQTLIRAFRPMLVDMGHTHYNEIANDGCTIYTTTRSTGQVEEGPVGFSITNIDGSVVSWKFKPLGEFPFAVITSPSDFRLITNPESTSHVVRGKVAARVKVWGPDPILGGALTVGNTQLSLRPVNGTLLWTAEIDTSNLPDGQHRLLVSLKDSTGRVAHDEITIQVNAKGEYAASPRHPRDQDNAIGEWLDRGLIGTQLGPNKNGRKW